MRSYRQYCSVAKALDVVGDRWTLLIVRELLLRGPSRYTDLRAGLPGIATNLLADRLRELEQAGIIERQDAPPPVATTLFRLTARGEELRPVVDALGRWGIPLMSETSPDEAFRSHWLRLPVEVFLVDRAPDEPPVTIEVNTGDQPMRIEAADGELNLRPGRAEHPDASLTGEPRPVLGLLSGKLSLGQARRQGVQYRGDPATLARVLPETVPVT
jgi:DNA-binding HxlR family transcriptional regulator